MPVNPYQKYKQQSIMTMTPGELLLKLFDETIKQLHYAQDALTEKRYEQANACMQKSSRIISHLNKTLDMQYEISNNLERLYDFFIHKITQANIYKDPSHIEEILPLIEDLRDAFSQADRQVTAGGPGAQAGQGVQGVRKEG